MTNSSKKLLVTMSAAVGLMLAISGASAQQTCNDPRIGKMPDGCQKERISATGSLRFLGDNSARKSAEAAWKREVLNKYGERFTVWDHAACPQTECTPGSIAGSKRCSFSGYPCAKASIEGSADLTTEEIKEMQKLLVRLGYPVSTDGKFGPNSSEALKKFQRANKFDEDGLPSKENLERLRGASAKKKA
jgi:hypothetical protein